MLASLALLMVACTATAEIAFTPSKEYVYSYTGRVVSGIPEIAPQFTGFLLKSKLILQVPSADKIVMQLRDVRVAHINKRVESEEEWKLIEAQTFTHISEKFPCLRLPVELRIRSGVVEGLEVSSEEPEWCINIKKGIASIIQINTGRVHEMDLSHSRSSYGAPSRGGASVQFEMRLESLRRQENRLREKLLEIESIPTESRPSKFSEITEMKEQIRTIESQKLELIKEMRGDDSKQWSTQTSTSWRRNSPWFTTSRQSSASWKTLEDGIEGICETIYTVSPISQAMLVDHLPHVPAELINDPENLHIITKTRNLDKCLKKATLQFVSPAGLKCDESVNAGCHFLYSRTSVTKYLIQGRMSNYKVIKTWTKSTLHLNPMGGKTETLVVNTNQTMTLEERTTISTPIQSIPSPRRIPTLAYRFTKTASNPKIPADARNILKSVYPSNILSEESYESSPYEDLHEPHQQWMHGMHREHVSEWRSGSVVISQIRELLSSIAADMFHLTDLDIKDTPTKFISLVSALKILNLSELKSLYPLVRETGMGTQTIVRNVLIDALTVAGTNPCFLFLKEAIETRAIYGETATQVLMALPNHIKTPTPALLESLWELIQSPAVKTSYQLEVTGILSLSNMIYHACINRNTTVTMYPVESKYHGFCSMHSSTILEKFIPYLEHIIKSDRPTSYKLGALQALGNLGHPSILDILEPIVYGVAIEDPLLRIQAIWATSRLARIKPNRVATFMRPVFSNFKEKYDIRMAALLTILETNPDTSYYQTLATRTWFEPSQQVNSLIHSVLHNFAKVELPQYRVQAARAASVLQIMKPMKTGIQYSHVFIASNYLKNSRIGSLFEFSTIGSKRSVVPKVLYSKWKTNVGGYTMTPLETAVHFEGLQKLINRVFGPEGALESAESIWDLLGELRSGPITREFPVNTLLEEIRSSLNIAPKKHIPVRGFAWMRLMGSMERVWSWDESVFTDFLREGVLRMRDPSGDLKSGIHINYNKIMSPIDIQIAIPSSMGLPILYDLKMPIAVSVRGNIQGDIIPGLFTPGSNKHIKIESTIKPMIAIQLLSKTKIISPLTEEIMATGVDHHLVSTLPVSVGLEVNTESKTARVSVVPVKEISKVDVLHLHTRPFTTMYKLHSFRPIVETPEFRVIRKYRHPRQRVIEFGRQSTGLQFVWMQKVDHPVVFDFPAFYRWLRGQSLITLPLTILAQPSLNSKEFKLIWDVSRSEVESIDMKFRYSTKTTEMIPESSTLSWIERNVNSIPTMISKLSSWQSSTPIEKYDVFELPVSSPEYISKWWNMQDSHWLLRTQGVDMDTWKTEPFSSESTIRSRFFNSRSSEDREWSGNYESAYPTYTLYKKEGSKLCRMEARVEFNGRSQRGLVVRATLGKGPQSLRYITGLEMEWINPTTGPYKVCAHGSINYPRIPIADMVMKTSSLKTFADLRVAFGSSCENHVEITGVMERTPEWLEHATTTIHARRCMRDLERDEKYSRDCMKLYKHASLMNKVTVSITHSHLPQSVVNTVRHVEEFLKATFYSNMMIDWTHPTETGTVMIQAYRKPEAPLWNIKCAKPDVFVVFKALREPKFLETVFPLSATQGVIRRTMDRVMRHQYKPFCKISKHTVQTFDNVTYPLPELGSCWKVLSTDCTKETNWAILGKQTHSGKAIRMILRHTTVEIYPQNGAYEVLINGTKTTYADVKEIRVPSHRTPLIHIESLSPVWLKVKSPYYGVSVKTNGQVIKVHVSNMFRDRVCGVCGDLNGEKIAESKTPGHCTVPFTDFVHSWVVSDSQSQCSVRPLPESHSRCALNEFIPTGRYWSSSSSFSGEGQEQWNEQQYVDQWRKEQWNVNQWKDHFRQQELNEKRWRDYLSQYPEKIYGEDWRQEESGSWFRQYPDYTTSYSMEHGPQQYGETDRLTRPWKQSEDEKWHGQWKSQGRLGNEITQERLKEWRRTDWELSDCTHPYTEVMHQPSSFGKKICFSVRPVMKCKPGCRPLMSMEDEIPFHCVEESKIAREMAITSQQSVLETMLSKPGDIVRTISMPRSCERLL